MGGAAFLLEGSVSPALLEERTQPRTLLDKLLFRTRKLAVERQNWGEETQLEVPLPSALRGLPVAYSEWLDGTLGASRSPALAALKDYLSVDVCDLNLRGVEKEGQPARFYLQLTFSGCAGMGETSAQVAAHWAQIWWERDPEGLSALCTPHGFTPGGIWQEGAMLDQLFFPLKEGGYAIYTEQESLPGASDHVPPPEALPWLEVDGALEEEHLDVMERLEQLKPLAKTTFRVRRCRCALCDPHFERNDDLAL